MPAAGRAMLRRGLRDSFSTLWRSWDAVRAPCQDRLSLIEWPIRAGDWTIKRPPDGRPPSTICEARCADEPRAYLTVEDSELVTVICFVAFTTCAVWL